MADTKEAPGMDKADLKKNFKIAKRQPMQVALAMLDGEVVLTMHKQKKGRSLLADLKKEAPATKDLRFGSCTIDEENTKRAIFTINKPVGGLTRKLIKSLKGTGINKILLQFEDGSEAEEHESDEDEEEEEDEDEDQDTDEDSDGDTKGQTRNPEVQEEDGSDTDQQEDEEPDADTLASDLKDLVKQMLPVIANDPSQKALMTELAIDAQAALKRGDLAQASAAIDIFREALEDAGGGDQSNDNKSASDEMDAEDDANGNTPISGESDDRGNSNEDGKAEEEEDTDSDQDPAELMSQLTGLVKRMMPIIAADPTQQDALRGIAQQAQAALKGGDHSDASDHIFSLRGLMDDWESNSGQANGAEGDSKGQGQEVEEDGDADHQAHAAAQAPTITKARSAWMATRQKIDGDMGKLHKAFGTAFEGHEKGDQIYGAFQTRVSTVLDTLSHELADMLEAVNNARTRMERQQMVEQAHKLLAEYQAHIASDQTIAALDKNPFMPLQVQKTMSATLAALSRTIA